MVVGNQNLRFGFDTADNLDIDNNTVMFIDHKTIDTIETGYVGIGTSVPTGQLHIKSINNNTGEWAQKITDSTDSNELIFGIENDGYLHYPHETKGLNKILTSDENGKSTWSTKEELGIAVPGLHSVTTTCDDYTPLQGNTDVYAFIDTTSGPYRTRGNVNREENRAIVFQAFQSGIVIINLTFNNNYNGNLYIAIGNGLDSDIDGDGLTDNSHERWLMQPYYVASSNMTASQRTTFVPAEEGGGR